MNDYITKLELENKRLTEELEKQRNLGLKFLKFFGKIMSDHDSSLVTTKHINRVTNMVKDIFQNKECRQYIMENINYDYILFKNSAILGAYLHDIGKFHIPMHILSKEGQLNKFELNLIQEHPKFGSVDLIDLPIDTKTYNLSIINNIILYHHCNMDGSGYPYDLCGNEIPFEARLVAICDRLEAMMAKRSYKLPMSFETCISELKTNTGKNSVDQSFLSIVESHADLFKKYEACHE